MLRRSRLEMFENSMHANMMNCKYFVIFFILPLCCATNKQCFWVIDAVEKENLSKVASVIVPGGQYFLRIRVKCDDKVNSEVARSLVLTGVNPVIKLESESLGLNHHNAQRYSILMTSALMEMGSQESCGCLLRNKSNGSDRSNKCFCDGAIPSCLHSDALPMVKEGNECCFIEKNCSSFKELCNPAWLAPLNIPALATILHCEVVDSGIGPYINSNRFTVHLDGYHLLVNKTIHNRLGDEVKQLPSISQETPVGCVPNFSPICVVGSSEMSNHIIYTASEFEKMQVLKIKFEDSVQNECTSQRSQSSLQGKGVLSLPDRILLNTGAGIFEVHADHASMSTGVKSLSEYRLVFSGCVGHLVSPAQSSVYKVAVLGFGEEQDEEKVFVALPEKGEPSNFVELRDSRDQNICQFLRGWLENTGSYPCQVISGSISGVKAECFVILVMLKTPHAETFHLVQFEGSASDGSWTALFNFPTSLGVPKTDHDNWQRIESKFSADNSGVSTLSLTDLSFTAIVCNSLFIWGNALFFSPDGGISIHWLADFPGNSTIMVFTSSASDETFAVLTDNQEVWVGQAGSAEVQRLKSSLGKNSLAPGLRAQNSSFVLSIFFDTARRLQKIVAEGRDDGGETKCISREEIPVGRIISRQVFAQKQEENVRKYQKSTTNSTSCLQKPSTILNQLNVVERACPFARIAFQATHDVLYTRKCFYKLEPTVQWDVSLIQKSTTLHEYFNKVNKAVDADCSGISQDRRQATKDVLPDVIQLGRSEWYSFVFYLYLDHGQFETSKNPWSLTHLQASLHVSDATALTVTSLRTELIPQKTVKYAVTVQDGGVKLPQYRPGEGLTPASLRIQIWNSGLSCSTSYGSRGSLQGSYAMAVLLGCPAGRKLVFDPEASKTATGKEHFCSPVHGVPCFYFYRDFLPVFKIVDLATGQINQFHGKYGLKIVGGGPSYDSITGYSQEQQTKYNSKTTSSMASLIWASKLKTLGDNPVFDSKTNGISWLCGTQSPCADIGPNFPGNAEYYFKLEFSNRIVDADSSNCDFTIRFLIRVHGLPPGSFNPSSVIVLSCIGILATLILTFYLLKRQDAKLWRQLKSVLSVFRQVCVLCRIFNLSGARLRRNRVDTQAGDVPLETIQEMNSETEGCDDASIDIKGNSSERHEHLTTNV